MHSRGRGEWLVGIADVDFLRQLAASEDVSHRDVFREEIESLLRWPRIERRFMHTLAGEAATYVLTGDRDPEGIGRSGERVSGDTRDVMGMCSSLFACGEDPKDPANQQADAYINWLWWRTVAFLQQAEVWSAVQYVANELVRRRTLSGADFAEVMTEWRQTLPGVSGLSRGGID